MISWGIIASGVGFIHSARQFYVMRFLLGSARPWVLPGMIIALSHWFTGARSRKAVACSTPPCLCRSSRASSGLLLGSTGSGSKGGVDLHSRGIPAFLLARQPLAANDWPRDAKWLAPEDRLTLQAAIDAGKHGKTSHMAVFEYLKHPTVIRLTLIYFFAVCGSYGFGLWLPTMLKQLSGLENTQVSLLAALPYVVALMCVVLFSWTSDKTGRRVLHTAVPLFVTALGLSIGSIWPVHGLFWVMFGFCVVGAGVYTHIPSFWSLPGKQLSGTAAAVSVAIINSFAIWVGSSGRISWVAAEAHQLVRGRYRVLPSPDHGRHPRADGPWDGRTHGLTRVEAEGRDLRNHWQVNAPQFDACSHGGVERRKPPAWDRRHRRRGYRTVRGRRWPDPASAIVSSAATSAGASSRNAGQVPTASGWIRRHSSVTASRAPANCSTSRARPSPHFGRLVHDASTSVSSSDGHPQAAESAHFMRSGKAGTARAGFRTSR
jgi:hypothetical protein